MGVTRFYLPTRFIIGAGSISSIGTEVARLGKTALLVTGSKSMRAAGVLDKVVKDLEDKGVKTVAYDRIESNPRASTIDRGAAIAREKGVQVIIGLGGGSAMDAAKCIALASCGPEPVWTHYEGHAGGDALPIVLVPTVAASGSEANNGAVLTNWDTHEKVFLSKNSMYPAVSIIDPALTITLPRKTTAQGGVDIFCHLVEAYITAGETTLINDSIRESSMKTVVESLPMVLNRLDDIENRSRLSWASTIACSQFAGLGGGMGAMTLHGMEHPLSGEYDIVHGDGLAALLIEWMKYTLPARSDRFKRLGKNVFGKEDGIAATAKWLKQIGMDLKLRDLGVKTADFDKLADNAVKTAPWLKSHPRPLESAEIADIYNRCF